MTAVEPKKAVRQTRAAAAAPKNIGQLLEINSIDFSPLNHRKRISAQEIDELAASVKEKGVIEPVIVRLKDKRFELVCGERRLRAALQVGLGEVPVIVQTLTDGQARELQLHENLHRKDPHPLDEARGYLELKDNHNLTVEQVAERVTKPIKHVAARLKLNDLILPAVQDLENDLLPVALAEEIARYPLESQAAVYNLCYETFWTTKGETADKTRPKRLAEVRTHAERSVMLKLKNAPFKLDAVNLRHDGLPCTACPQRTGAQIFLFDTIGADDACLNRICFSGKITQFIELKREKIAFDANKKRAPETKSAATAQNGVAAKPLTAADVPLITTEYAANDAAKNILGWSDFREIGANEAACQSIETAVYKDGAKFGSKIKICRDKTCQTHFRYYQGNGSAAATSNVRTQAQKDDRNQEIFDIKVAEPVRLEVFKNAKDRFDESKWIFDEPKWRLLLLFYVYRNEDQKRRKIALETVGIEQDEMPDSHLKDDAAIVAKLELIRLDKLSQLFFLLLVSHRGEIGYSKSLINQDPVKTVAADFGVDYRLLDAQKRVQIAPKRHKPKAQAYLARVENGDSNTNVPRFYGEAPAQEAHALIAQTSAAQPAPPIKEQAAAEEAGGEATELTRAPEFDREPLKQAA